MTFGSLFSCIGGLDLGLERGGMRCVWQCEKDSFRRQVLRKHWPDTPIYEDAESIDYSTIGQCDAIAGGFPCTDISDAGERAGLAGSDSGLWREMVRAFRLVRPKIGLVENVAALLHRGMGQVLGDLAEIGRDAEWDCIPACAFGARHIRDRVFIATTTGSMDNPNIFDARCFRGQAEAYRRWTENTPIRSCFDGGAWAREPELARVAYGVPDRVDRLAALGAVVVPQVAEWIGKRIIEASEQAYERTN